MQSEKMNNHKRSSCRWVGLASAHKEIMTEKTHEEEWWLKNKGTWGP